MSIGLKGAIVAAKTLALTVAQTSTSPELIAAAKAEFDKSRGSGFVYKPLIGDRAPPLDYTKASSAGARDPG
jgi:aminobenzoyl-glutamate utilization protein B